MARKIIYFYGPSTGLLNYQRAAMVQKHPIVKSGQPKSWCFFVTVRQARMRAIVVEGALVIRVSGNVVLLPHNDYVERGN